MKYGEDRSVKLYFSISEVSEMTEVAQHVLRYWEQEFPMLKPKKNRAGNRSYREKDIELIRTIKTLLYQEKFTIDGARRRLKEDPSYLTESLHVTEVIEQQPLDQKQTNTDPSVLEHEKRERVRETGRIVLSELKAIRAMLHGGEG